MAQAWKLKPAASNRIAVFKLPETSESFVITIIIIIIIISISIKINISWPPLGVGWTDHRTIGQGTNLGSVLNQPINSRYCESQVTEILYVCSYLVVLEWSPIWFRSPFSPKKLILTSRVPMEPQKKALTLLMDPKPRPGGLLLESNN